MNSTYLVYTYLQYRIISILAHRTLLPTTVYCRCLYSYDANSNKCKHHSIILFYARTYIHIKDHMRLVLLYDEQLLCVVLGRIYV